MLGELRRLRADVAELKALLVTIAGRQPEIDVFERAVLAAIVQETSGSVFAAAELFKDDTPAVVQNAIRECFETPVELASFLRRCKDRRIGNVQLRRVQGRSAAGAKWVFERIDE
jgi:hypothetical protein